MKKLLMPLLMLCLFSLHACESNLDELEKFNLIIASSLGYYEDASGNVVSGYLVKYEHDEDWEFFNVILRNFDYEEGYEYIVTIRSERIQDSRLNVYSSNRIYYVTKVISKVKKEYR